MSNALKSAPGKRPATKLRSAISKRAKPGAAMKRTIKSGSAKASMALTQSDKTEVRAKTLRLQPNYEKGLAFLKQVLNVPINKMVNEAVGDYIRRRTAEMESGLTTTLEQLQAYRRSDPEFSAARRSFIDAELHHGKDDPMEGRIVTAAASSRVAAKQPTLVTDEDAAAGPVLRKVRELMRG